MIEAMRRPGGWALPNNRWDLLEALGPESLPTVSVVVAHFRQPTQLNRTLLALERQNYPRDLVEVIVVDDGSPEPPTVPEGVRLVVQEDRGFRLAAARNLAVAEASNDVLVFLDADTAPEPDYLRHLVRLPALTWDAVTVGRRRHADLSAAPTDADLATAALDTELEEPRWLLDAYRDTGNLLEADARSYRFVIGAVIACTRRLYDEVGGFDESFTRYGGEDWEWTYRAWLRGAVLAHVPAAVAWHDGADQASRDEAAVAIKNAEALTLAELIPVPQSTGRALPRLKADVVIVGPPAGSTRGQTFVSHDSVLAEIPSATLVGVDWVAEDRLDRVRVEVVIEHPVKVTPGAFAEAMTALDTGLFAHVVLRSDEGTPLVRLTSRRAAARQARWGGDPLLPDLDLPAAGIIPLLGEVSVSAYVGGWD